MVAIAQALALLLAAEPARAAAPDGCWVESAQPAVFENDQYVTLKRYLTRARAGLRRRPATLEGFGLLVDTEAARIPAALRSQGLAFDGEAVVFSWRYGLQRTDARYRPLVTRALAIPPDIRAEHFDAAKNDGFSHIGDIDVADGRLYAPIEDEDHRAKPFIAVFDAKTLRYTGEKHLLPVDELPHGVPWIGVDAPAGVFYTMDWDSPDLLTFDLKTYTLRRRTPLRAAVKRVQGGKVHGGLIYLASDVDRRKAIWEVDPRTGAAREIAHFDEPERAELEGLAFGPDGALRALIMAPYSYGESFPADLELNDDDWPPSARLVRLRPGPCR